MSTVRVGDFRQWGAHMYVVVSIDVWRSATVVFFTPENRETRLSTVHWSVNSITFDRLHVEGFKGNGS